MLVIRHRHRRRQDGFTLVELLVTMLIVTVGLLGLAKMQATAVSNTSMARTRALMTYQAESLAGMMRANRDFWLTTGSSTVWPRFVLSSAGGKTFTGFPSTWKSCIGATCAANELALDDLTTWAKQFNDGTASSAFPLAQATIACVSASGGACGADPTTPHSYDITLTWQQKLVAVNRSTVNSASTTPVTMVMHVQP